MLIGCPRGCRVLLDLGLGGGPGNLAQAVPCGGELVYRRLVEQVIVRGDGDGQEVGGGVPVLGLDGDLPPGLAVPGADWRFPGHGGAGVGKCDRDAVRAGQAAVWRQGDGIAAVLVLGLLAAHRQGGNKVVGGPHRQSAQFHGLSAVGEGQGLAVVLGFVQGGPVLDGLAVQGKGHALGVMLHDLGLAVGEIGRGLDAAQVQFSALAVRQVGGGGDGEAVHGDGVHIHRGGDGLFTAVQQAGDVGGAGDGESLGVEVLRVILDVVRVPGHISGGGADGGGNVHRFGQFGHQFHQTDTAVRGDGGVGNASILGVHIVFVPAVDRRVGGVQHRVGVGLWPGEILIPGAIGGVLVTVEQVGHLAAGKFLSGLSAVGGIAVSK